MPQTPYYGIPYQAVTEAPDGPNLGEDGFTRVDTVLLGIDNRLTTIEPIVTSLSAAAYRSSQLVSIAVASVTFTGIPTTLRKLILTWTARSSAVAVAQNLRVRVNNDSAINYNYNFTQQNNVTNTPIAGAAQTYWQIGVLPANTAAANNFGSGEMIIPGWNAPHAGGINQQHRSHMWEAAATSWYQSGGGLYFAAGPYTRLDIFCDAGNIVAGSEFLLEGLV